MSKKLSWKRQSATYLISVYRVVGVLVDEALDLLNKVPNSIVSPPSMQIAFLVVVSALIVKGMSQLVTHDNTHGSEIQWLWVVQVIKGSLKNSSRKYDLILQRSVIGIDCWRSHFPFSLVCRLHLLFQVLSKGIHADFDVVFKVLILLEFKLYFKEVKRKSTRISSKGKQGLESGKKTDTESKVTFNG